MRRSSYVLPVGVYICSYYSVFLDGTDAAGNREDKFTSCITSRVSAVLFFDEIHISEHQLSLIDWSDSRGSYADLLRGQQREIRIRNKDITIMLTEIAVYHEKSHPVAFKIPGNLYISPKDGRNLKRKKWRTFFLWRRARRIFCCIAVNGIAITCVDREINVRLYVEIPRKQRWFVREIAILENNLLRSADRIDISWYSAAACTWVRIIPRHS